jgi:hypothetical protein
VANIGEIEREIEVTPISVPVEPSIPAPSTPATPDRELEPA